MLLTYHPYLILSFAVFVGLTVIVAKYFNRLWPGESKSKFYFVGFLVAMFTTLSLFFILETYLFLFFTPSDGFNFTLTSRRWFKKYWYPLNSMEYRDNEHSASDFVGKKVLFVLGDSIVAGHGIKDYEDRFSNELQRKLGNKWAVVNIAKCGWGTVDEYKAILSYPQKPDVIVFSYYPNDIYPIANQMGLGPSNIKQVEQPSAILEPLIDNFYVFDYTYWGLYRFRSADVGQHYWQHLKDCYANEDIWAAHKKEILDIVNYTKDNNIKLVTVLFPPLKRIKESKVFVSKIAEVMDQNEVELIDLSVEYADRNPKELIVNHLDVHPSVQLHKEVGELLFRRISKIDNIAIAR